MCFLPYFKESKMSDEVGKYDEFGDLSLSGSNDGNSNLDEYGVWIKKKPSADDEVFQDEMQSDQEGEKSLDVEADVPFDFDGLDESDFSIDETEKELTDSDLTFDESSSDSTFSDVDMSDFFTDLGSNAESEEVTKKEEEEALKMDLNFDTVDSYMQGKEETDDFESMLDNPEISTDSKPQEVSEFDDLLSEINSSTPPSTSKTKNNDSDGFNGHNIDLNVDVDETQDFSNIGSSSDSEETIVLPSPASKVDKMYKKTNEEDSIVVRNTVVEPENINEIVEENRKVMKENTTKREEDNFNDVEALANDLASDSSCVNNNFNVKADGVVSVKGLDKITDLLTNIVGELSSLKKEISMLKVNIHTVENGNASLEKNSVEQEEATGFFKDEDTDEAIALTGDELNNILITADFTDENDHSAVQDTADEAAESCEVCSDETEEKLEDNFSSGRDVDFDDITLEDTKLDDFVIPEELDYNMLNSENDGVKTDENAETASTEGSDMSYLDESDSEDEVSLEIPETQDIAVEASNDKVASEKSNNEGVSSNSEVLPSDIKNKVKSVLAYMDQLLESLPEDKMKEFAESEYFEMYNKLFSELGIS